MHVAEIAASVWLGTLFIYAGGQKAAVFRWGGRDLAAYRLLPKPLLAPVSAALPPVEIAAGTLLLAGPVRVGGLLAAALGVSFATTSAIVMLRGDTVSCGCAGKKDDIVSWRTLVRGAAIAAAGAFLASRGPFATVGLWAIALAGVALLPAGLMLRARVIKRRRQRGFYGKRDQEIADLLTLLSQPPPQPAAIS
jgi:hypothetical protein